MYLTRYCYLTQSYNMQNCVKATHLFFVLFCLLVFQYDFCHLSTGIFAYFVIFLSSIYLNVELIQEALTFVFVSFIFFKMFNLET